MNFAPKCLGSPKQQLVRLFDGACTKPRATRSKRLHLLLYEFLIIICSESVERHAWSSGNIMPPVLVVMVVMMIMTMPVLVVMVVMMIMTMI